MKDDNELFSQVAAAYSVGQRVFGEHGVAEQLADGNVDFLRGAALDEDLADVWTAAAEHAKFARAVTPSPTGVVDLEPQWSGSLPLNRKERFYTGTVLPCLITSDGFAHLDRFLRLCGVADVGFSGLLNQLPEVTFFTEYGFSESIFKPADRERWSGTFARDTPDVVIAGLDWLVAIEAKMYDRPDSASLSAQMARQAVLLAEWTEKLGLPPDRVRHVLLLPEQLAREVDVPAADACVTWQQVLEDYRLVGPLYWAQMLRIALAEYDALASVPVCFGANSAERLAGAQILERFAAGTLGFDAVGRDGGLNGAKFQTDVASGSWRTFTYEVRAGGAPNRNWFKIKDFIGAVSQEPAP